MKKPILTTLDLSERIQELQTLKQQQEAQLQQQLRQTLHTLRPGNLIKQGISKLSEMPVATSLIGTGVNLGVDLLSNKLLGKQGGTVKSLAKGAIRYGVSKLLGDKADTIKAYASVLLNRLTKKREKNQ